MKYLRRELERVNWSRVWLIVFIGLAIIIFGSCTINGILNS